MEEKFDIEERWPELFEPLDEEQRWSIRQVLASSWHEGWVPNREDVELLSLHAQGLIDDNEYLRRTFAAAGVEPPPTAPVDAPTAAVGE